MLEPPCILTTTARLFAGLRLTIPKAAIQHEMGPGLREVHAALAAQSVAPAGPWFTHHLRIEAERWDFEICVPVAKPIHASDRVYAGEWTAMTVARAILRGGYQSLGAAWGELDAWVLAQARTPSAELWEVYTVGPEASADVSAWRTELSRPLADAR